MASSQKTVDYILEQIEGAGDVRARKMFGEYAIYCDEKIVAVVADEQLFIKPTEAGKKFLGAVIEKPPYVGAKPWFLISGERWDDRQWLTKLVRASAAQLAVTKKKAAKRARP